VPGYRVSYRAIAPALQGVTTSKYLPRNDHHIRLPTHCCGRCDLATGAELKKRKTLEMMLLLEGSYTMLIPEDEDVVVGMRARKGGDVQSRSHVRRWLARTRWSAASVYSGWRW